MAGIFLSDDQIKYLLTAPKRVVSQSRPKSSKGSERWDYTIRLSDGSTLILYARQNIIEDESFSCGLRLDRDGETFTLCRYNGASHPHKNPIENEQLVFVEHIHMATERYQVAGMEPDKFAIITDRYKTLNQALKCLVEDCNIEGVDFSSLQSAKDMFQ